MHSTITSICILLAVVYDRNKKSYSQPRFSIRPAYSGLQFPGWAASFPPFPKYFPTVFPQLSHSGFFFKNHCGQGIFADHLLKYPALYPHTHNLIHNI